MLTLRELARGCHGESKVDVSPILAFPALHRLALHLLSELQCRSSHLLFYSGRATKALSLFVSVLFPAPQSGTQERKTVVCKWYDLTRLSIYCRRRASSQWIRSRWSFYELVCLRHGCPDVRRHHPHCCCRLAEQMQNAEVSVR